jgi:hypothetical protein
VFEFRRNGGDRVERSKNQNSIILGRGKTGGTIGRADIVEQFGLACDASLGKG